MASPCTEVTVVTPPIVPTPLAKLTLTGILAVVTRLSRASRTSITGGAVNAVPEGMSVGCVRMNSLAGAPGVTLTAIVPVAPNDVALIVVCPTVVAVTTPSADTAATVGVLELHTTAGDATTCARLSVTRAASDSVDPAATVATPPLADTDTVGGTSGATGSPPPPHAAATNTMATCTVHRMARIIPALIAAPEWSPSPAHCFPARSTR